MYTYIESLKEKMIDAHLNAAQLAKHLDLDHNTVQKWLTKSSHPRINNLIKAADFFSCSIDYLLGLTDVPDFRRSEHPAAFIERLDMLKANDEWKNDNLIAIHCGVGNSAVSKWRRFGNYPDVLTIVRLAEHFGCTVEYLIGRSDG